MTELPGSLKTNLKNSDVHVNIALYDSDIEIDITLININFTLDGLCLWYLQLDFIIFFSSYSFEQ